MDIQNVKLGVSRQVVIPKQFWDDLNLQSGEYISIKKQGNSLTLTPQASVDRDIDPDIAQSLKDFKEGRYYGPFNTAEELIKSLHENVKQIRTNRKKVGKTL